MSNDSDGDNRSLSIGTEVAAHQDTEEFGGGEPVCWLAMLDEDGTMPEPPRGDAVLPPDSHPTTAAQSGAAAAHVPIIVPAPSPTSALAP